MNARRRAAILFIFVSTALAWFILGSSVVVRSGGTDSALGAEVTRL